MFYTYHKTPIGNIFIAGDGKTIKLMSFPEGRQQRRPQADWQATNNPFKQAIKQLDDYFSGKLKNLISLCNQAALNFSSKSGKRC